MSYGPELLAQWRGRNRSTPSQVRARAPVMSPRNARSSTENACPRPGERGERSSGRERTPSHSTSLSLEAGKRGATAANETARAAKDTLRRMASPPAGGEEARPAAVLEDLGR